MVDDIAYESEAAKNADPCTSRGCMWPKSSDGKVYVPYVIANQYCECFRHMLPMKTIIKIGKQSCPVNEMGLKIACGPTLLGFMCMNIAYFRR